ncbi:alpha/beta hydrolase domain-containing protein [Trinickia sp.]|uniref:alpha/beta hydrolase domain-containing protein n=1 Tax=Trinickia sp. TaxID=2571163 RepID=UPI003F7D125D
MAGIVAWMPATAQVTDLHVLSVEPSALQGRVFGAGGTARKIVAQASIAVDPFDPRNAGIADITLAPRDANGRVVAVADVVILEPAHANGTLIVEVPNRGRKLIGRFVDDAPSSFGRLSDSGDAGKGFLLSKGYTLVWIGWQGDIVPDGHLLGLSVPTLADITGPSRDEWVFGTRQSAQRQTVKLSYPAVKEEGASLTVRAHLRDARQKPEGLSFRFLDDSTLEINRPSGQPPNAIYEFVYTARAPKVLGLGFAALRDVAYFLGREGSAANPLARDGHPLMRHLLGFGVSQSGRALRDFLYQGFNEAANHRPVFDGLIMQVPGARRTFTNVRFGQPARNPGPNSDDLYPVDQFPMAYEASIDPHTNRRDGLLERCRASGTCPRIMQVDSEYEIWASHGSQTVTDPTGQHLGLPPEVRAYLIAGAPHYAFVDSVATSSPECRLPTSPLYAGPLMRALLVDMEGWVSRKISPPNSRYPMVADGTLVRAEIDTQYQGMSVLGYQGYVQPSYRTDASTGLPRIEGEYPVLTVRTDRDGHALGAIRLPEVAVPRATYIGWNPRSDVADGICTQLGARVPFARTYSERIATGDVRQSLDERYPRPKDYEQAIRKNVRSLVQQRLLLPIDASVALSRALNLVVSAAPIPR